MRGQNIFKLWSTCNKHYYEAIKALVIFAVISCGRIIEIKNSKISENFSGENRYLGDARSPLLITIICAKNNLTN